MHLLDRLVARERGVARVPRFNPGRRPRHFARGPVANEADGTLHRVARDAAGELVAAPVHRGLERHALPGEPAFLDAAAAAAGVQRALEDLEILLQGEI